MKLKHLLLFSLTILTFSCKKFDEKTQFEFEIEQEVTIPSIIGIQAPFNIPTYDVNTTIDHQLEIHDKRKKKIEHIYLTNLASNILSPSSQTFNFLKDITIQISANGLPQITVAEAKNLQNKNLKTLNIPVIQDLDLVDYIKQDQIDITANVTTDETIFTDVKINIIPRFFVDVKVFGI